VPFTGHGGSSPPSDTRYVHDRPALRLGRSLFSGPGRRLAVPQVAGRSTLCLRDRLDRSWHRPRNPRAERAASRQAFRLQPCVRNCSLRFAAYSTVRLREIGRQLTRFPVAGLWWSCRHRRGWQSVYAYPDRLRLRNIGSPRSEANAMKPEPIGASQLPGDTPASAAPDLHTRHRRSRGRKIALDPSGQRFV
jgi:hypothetical protein